MPPLRLERLAYALLALTLVAPLGFVGVESMGDIAGTLAVTTGLSAVPLAWRSS